jgi:hypothetical protein
VRLWIVETNQGTRIVVHAEHATGAVDGISAAYSNDVRCVREWPDCSPFRVRFQPATPIDEDGAMPTCFGMGWPTGVSSCRWQRRPPERSSWPTGAASPRTFL